MWNDGRGNRKEKESSRGKKRGRVAEEKIESKRRREMKRGAGRNTKQSRKIKKQQRRQGTSEGRRKGWRLWNVGRGGGGERRSEGKKETEKILESKTNIKAK